MGPAFIKALQADGQRTTAMRGARLSGAMRRGAISISAVTASFISLVVVMQACTDYPSGTAIGVTAVAAGLVDGPTRMETARLVGGGGFADALVRVSPSRGSLSRSAKAPFLIFYGDPSATAIGGGSVLAVVGIATAPASHGDPEGASGLSVPLAFNRSIRLSPV